MAVTDVLTGLYAAVGILACLHVRQHSGHGYALDLALLDCAVAAQVNVAQAYLTSGSVPPRQGNAHLQIVLYQLFATADGWLVLAVGNDRQWQHYCTAAARPDLAADPHFATNPLRMQNRTVLVPLVEALMTQNPGMAGAPGGRRRAPCPCLELCGTVRSSTNGRAGLAVTVRDPDGNPVDLLGSPFHLGGSPCRRCRRRLGQDTDAVLRDLLGLDAERLLALRAQGVI